MQLRLLATTVLKTTSPISRQCNNENSSRALRYRGGGGHHRYRNRYSSFGRSLTPSLLLLSSSSSSSSLSTTALSVSTTSTAAAVAAPLASTLGIHVWDRWKGSSFMLNVFKCTLSTLLFGLTLLLQPSSSCTTTHPHTPLSLITSFVSSESTKNVQMLFLSSFMGIIVGDLLWLEALSRLGAHDTILMSALHPVFAWMMGTFLLGQPNPRSTLLGIIMVSSGLVLSQWFASSHNHHTDESCESTAPPPTTMTTTTTKLTPHSNRQRQRQRQRQRRIVGYLLNLTNMMLDIVGVILTRQFGTSYNTFEICFIRFGFASLGLGLIGVGGHAWVGAQHVVARPKRSPITTTTATTTTTLVQKSKLLPPSWATIPSHSMSTWIYMSLGVFLVTYLSPALGNYALFGLPLAVWTALGSLGPVYSLLVVKGKELFPSSSSSSSSTAAPVAPAAPGESQAANTPPPSPPRTLSSSGASIVGALLAVGGSILLSLSTTPATT